MVEVAAGIYVNFLKIVNLIQNQNFGRNFIENHEFWCDVGRFGIDILKIGFW